LRGTASERFDSYAAFYEECRRLSQHEGTSSSTDPDIIAEYNWLDGRKPYYKLWPAYAMMLVQTSLNVPVEVMHPPHVSYGVFLPKGYDLFHYQHQGRTLELRSLLASAAIDLHSGCLTWTIIVDDGEEARSRTLMRIRAGKTVEQCATAVEWDSCTDGSTSHDMLMDATRLAVAVALLAVSVHRCVEHDVIAALRGRYEAAKTIEERESLAEKSRRRGVNGWCIGRGRDLALTTGTREDSAATGRHLNYQHVRGGHFHTVLHGKGHAMRRVVFFEPTVVRPDLPLPPLARCDFPLDSASEAAKV
jgi:hypothetical protein